MIPPVDSSEKKKGCLGLISSACKALPWLFSLGLLSVVVFIIFQVKGCKEPVFSITDTNAEARIHISPEEIRHIEDIGQWVFLNIETQELVDTVRKHIFGSDDALSRIYTGNLHFGLDMETLRGKEWFTVSGDTARLALPAIRILDQNFIDEASTRTFYQSGEWDGPAFKALYGKARRQMLFRCNTPKNRRQAQRNAEDEITAFIRSFGFQEVELTFGE